MNAPIRRLLLAGVSTAALLGSAGAARAASVFNPAYFAARTGSRSAAAAIQAQAAMATGNVARAAQSMADLQRMAAAIRQAGAAQVAAAALANAASHASQAASVPDGLVPGGLQVLPGAVAGTRAWSGAHLPTQAAGGNGRTAVAVVQTTSAASLTWQTFNVGPHTDLTFDQSAGGSAASTWVVLNRVQDPAANPSQILGSITAPGHVLILNPNGILFGGAAQVNVGALVASTGHLTQTDTQFLQNGIYSTGTTLDAQGNTLEVPTFTGASAGAIVVQPGAAITTLPPAGTGAAGGAVLLLGGTVTNAGGITTPSGQTVLAAGNSFFLNPGSPTDPTATTLGTQVAVTHGGAVANTGIVSAALGDITLTGRTVTQAGVVLSSTSVNQRGTVHLLTDSLTTPAPNANGSVSLTADPNGTVTVGPGSLTAVTLDTSGATALDSQRNSLIAGSNTPSFPNNDRLDESRIEITSGNVVEFTPGSLTMAQGGQIPVTATRILLDSAATLDVGGAADAVLPVSSNVFQVTIEKTALRDDPLNRDSGNLANQTVYVDQRFDVTVPGTVAGYGGNVYTGGGLLVVGSSAVSTNTADNTAGLLQTSGNIALQGHTIQEWAASGGTVTLAGNVVAAQTGSVINVSGGNITYTPGYVPQSWLIGANGHLYNVNTAPATEEYLGVFNGFDEQHPHWSVNKVFYNPLIAPPAYYESGYTVGRDGGTLEVQDSSTTRVQGGVTATIAPAVLFNALVVASVTPGALQTAARNPALIDSYQQAQNAVPRPGALLIGQYVNDTTLTGGGTLDVQIGSGTSDADTVTAASPVTGADRHTMVLNAAALNSFGLGALAITSADTLAGVGGTIAVTAPLAVADGGTLSLIGAGVSATAPISARSGAITFTDLLGTTPITHGGRASVGLAPGVTLDGRGTFTNAALNPTDVTGEAFVNGGTVALVSTQTLNVPAGSAIDVSSGAAYLASGTLLAGKGGSITLAGDLAPGGGTIGHAPVAVAGTLLGYGVSGGGTLSITALAATISTAAQSDFTGGLTLTPDFFTHGFTSYAIDGLRGITVTDGTTVEPVAPVWQLSPTTRDRPTDDSPADALTLSVLPVFLPNPATASISQRPGAGLSLTAYNGDTANPLGGSITLGAGSVIAVDPLQSVRIVAYNQVTALGTIVAPGGSIALLNRREDTGVLAPQYKVGLSVWLGGQSRLSTAGAAASFPDLHGRSFGTVEAGGTITLGDDGTITLGTLVRTTDASVIVRPGAVVDASGAAAFLDPFAGSGYGDSDTAPGVSSGPTLVATSGGTITLSSASGIFDEGALVAAAGGAGASGGTLAVIMETPQFNEELKAPPPDAVLVPHDILLSQTSRRLLPAGLRPGQFTSQSLIGEAPLGVDQIAAGGFTNLSLYAHDAFLIRGGTSLSVPGTLTLTEGNLSNAGGAAPSVIAASVLQLQGYDSSIVTSVVPAVGLGQPGTLTHGTLALDAGLVEISRQVAFGVSNTINTGYVVSGSLIMPTHSYRVTDAGFSQIDLSSSGDIVFGPGVGSSNTTLNTKGSLTLAAARIYPETSTPATAVQAPQVATIEVGENVNAPGARVLTILGFGGPATTPLSAGGSLVLNAPTIDQAGTIFAPQGTIEFVTPSVTLTSGGVNTVRPGQVTLEPGSLTSVSANGALIPYGGTPDGVSYSYDGTTVGTLSPVVSFGLISAGTLTSEGASIAVQPGAVIDLSGGGELLGAGFLAGRGGSADVLTTPLLSINAATRTVNTASLAATPVYAIVPGFNAAFAPMAPADANYAAVSPGQQITIGAGVPGLQAGTYTLLPAYYALLPGGFRVQLGGTLGVRPGLAAALPDGSTLVAAQEGNRVTGLTSGLPVGATVTPGGVVRADSAYDEETYSQFQTAQAALEGLPRFPIVADAKTLEIGLATPGRGRATFTFDGALLGTPAPGGIGDTAVVQTTAPLSIVADGGSAPSGTAVIAAVDLDALNVQRLVIGDIGVTDSLGAVPTIAVFGTASKVVVGSGAVLHGPEIFLASAGSMTIDPGATITALGAGPVAYDSSDGWFYQFGSPGGEVLAVSNGNLIQLPVPASQAAGVLKIGAGDALLADGSLALNTPGGLVFGSSIDIGARYLSVTAPSINIGSAQDLAQARVPNGLVLGQDLLTQLLRGDPATGAPALQTLSLTAPSSLNFFGTVSLDTTGAGALQDLVINTPAIYGFGNAHDLASITAGTLYVSGVVVSQTLTSGAVTTAGTSVLPGGTIAHGPGTGGGTLLLQAGTIVLGYGPDSQPDNQTVANRLVEGFSTVDLLAGSEITANNLGSLTVYKAAASQYGQPGTGGVLNLVTPLLTGAAGSRMTYAAGNAVNLAPPAGGPPGVASAASLGAEIDIDAPAVTIAGSVALEGGRFDVNARGEIALVDGSRIDVSGGTQTFFDQSRAIPGGQVTLESAGGGIIQTPGAVIDIAADASNAGSLTVTALGGRGVVSLDGPVLGGGGPGDAGGTLDVRAHALADFSALNASLNAGGVTGARTIEVATGSLAVDGLIVAHTVDLSADAGALSVTGTIDASGAAPGTIELAAGGQLGIGSGAVLDAAGSVLQTDSYGQPIEAENRGLIALTAANGRLSPKGSLSGGGSIAIQAGAAFDLSTPDGTSHGVLVLNAPRTGETADGIAANVASPLALSGIGTIEANAFWVYAPHDTAGTIVQDNGGSTPVAAASGAVGLNQIDARNRAFFAVAEPGGTLSATLATALAGIAKQPGFLLQPGVEIRSAKRDGDLNVSGDLNLAGFRYGPGKIPADPGVLVIRAGGNLSINGSITDGFANPPDNVVTNGTTLVNPDDLGWILRSGRELSGQPVVLPVGLGQSVVLGAGTSFLSNIDATLGYDITINTVAITGGTLIPQAVTLTAPQQFSLFPSYTFTSAWTATAPILNASKQVVFSAGQIIPQGTTLQAGWTLGAGSVLPFGVGLVKGTVWKAGSPLSVLTSGTNIALVASATLEPGALIPAGTSVRFASGATSVNLRPVVGGKQGEIYADAPLLPPGSLSWSLDLVGGANLRAADPLAVQAPDALAATQSGNIVLSDLHYTSPPTRVSPSFSVIRTGTGSLNIAAGGSFSEDSLFGVYTAGAQSSGVASAFEQPRGVDQFGDGFVLGKTSVYNNFITGYQAWYPTGGGDVLLAAQGDVTGDIIDRGTTAYSSDFVSDWLWRQATGGAAGVTAEPTAWWINFGTYVQPLDGTNNGTQVKGTPILVGFTGIGTLGGGNLSIKAGGDIGSVAYNQNPAAVASTGLVAAVGDTGRVTHVTTTGTQVVGGTLVQTGGGTLSIDAAGAINPALPIATGTSDSYGVVTDLRGDITIQAAAIGQNGLTYAAGSTLDVRALDPFTAEQAQGSGGLVIAPGDSAVSIDTLRDLVLQGVADPTRVTPINPSAVSFTTAGTSETNVALGVPAFSTWTAQTQVSLLSEGGNVGFRATPATGSILNETATDGRTVIPSILSVAAAGGSVYFGGGELELAPSAAGELNLLAEDSIYGAYQVFSGATLEALDMSGAQPGPNGVSNPFRPAFSGPLDGSFGPNSNLGATATSTYSLFAFRPDTPTATLHLPGSPPQHIYAATGDIVGLNLGEVLVNQRNSTALPGNQPEYIAASAVDLEAGRDIVASGTRPATNSIADTTYPNQAVSSTPGVDYTGDLFLNPGSNDVSVVSAGRDILYSYFYVAGGGLLAVQAGRNLNQSDEGQIKSVGPIFDINPTNHNQGASIAVTVGQTADYAAFAQAYLNPDNLADPNAPLASAQNAGKVAAIYTDQLVAWLQANYGYTGDAAGALAFFQANVPVLQQDSFVRGIFYDELIASGREETNSASSRYRTYIRGQDAIDVLFPGSTGGVPQGDSGSLTMTSGFVFPGNILSPGSRYPQPPIGGVPAVTGVFNIYDAGISTLFGGDIDILAPGGQVILGSGAVIPGSGTGLVTYGSGNINVFAQGSVLLGQSRIFTTFGGGIDIWSADGDISAGVGSQTSLIFNPPLVSYDAFGGITVAPNTPSSGAGIATLAAVAGVSPGDVDLVAPSGTIDAGEAGIRVSGNLNLAALAISNAANIQVGGKTTGAPTVQVANVGALSAAAAASGAAENAATQAAQRQTANTSSGSDSIITVEVLGFGS